VSTTEDIGTKNSPRRSNRRYGNYRSLRHMYNELKPDMTYVAFYKRDKTLMHPFDRGVVKQIADWLTNP
jgi:hypothetical protein